MGGFGTVVLVLALLFGLTRSAGACINATMSETEAVKKLKEAEVALARGDVLTARELAGEVNEIYGLMTSGTAEPLVVRAARVEALAYVRDPKATSEELRRATTDLRDWVEQKHGLRDEPPPTPDLLADFGEALERSEQPMEAYDVLLPLVEKDLVGSSYALAAFSRAASAKGDAARADLAQKRCETVAVNPAACRGEYPRRPFLRGEPLDFALLAAPFLALAAWRIRRKKLWSSFHAPWHAALVVAFAAGAFAVTNLRFGKLGLAIALPVVLFIGLVQRAAWVKAVRRGEMPGFVIRPEAAEDGGATSAPTLWFLDGPRVPEVLEGVAGESYRESARPPILFRLEQNRVEVGRLFVVGIVIALFAGCAFVLMTLTRGG